MHFSLVHALLLALLAGQLLRRVDAGPLYGPCTINADLNTLQGICPDGSQVCIETVNLMRHANGSAIMRLSNSCETSGNVTTADNGSEARVQVNIRDGYFVSVTGTQTAHAVALHRDSDGRLLCGAAATIVEGICLYSETPTPGGISEAATSHMHIASCVFAIIVTLFVLLV